MFKKVKSWIRRYFGFSRTETSGFMILVGLFPIVLFFPVFLKMVINQNTYNTKINTQELDSLVALMEEKIVSSKKTKAANKEIKKIKLTKFNPNTAKFEELLHLGITAKIASRIINYRRKGGNFVVKQDLKKIYGLTEDEFHRLKYYIDLPNQILHDDKKPEAGKKTIDFPDKVLNDQFDINKVDTAQLMSIPGIGRTLSARIVKFRDKLGGFVTIDQIDEVYGLSQEVIKSIRKKGFIEDQFRPELINLNTASGNRLGTHPYISKRLAGQIVKYRDQHGRYENLEQLMNIHLIDKNDYDRLKPYLTL